MWTCSQATDSRKRPRTCSKMCCSARPGIRQLSNGCSICISAREMNAGRRSLASQLEQIHRERNDTVNADRFSELRQRFQKAAGMTEEELPAVPAMSAQVAAVPAPVEQLVKEPQAAVETAPVVSVAPAAAEPPVFEVAPTPAAAGSAPAEATSDFVEFEIPLIQPDAETISSRATESAASAPSVVVKLEAERTPEVAAAPAQPVGVGADEVDLSDEWEAMVQDVAEPAAVAAPETPAEPPEETLVEIASRSQLPRKPPRNLRLSRRPNRLPSKPLNQRPSPRSTSWQTNLSQF